MESENNYFVGKVGNPYHLSVGAVVRNVEGKILCHKFPNVKDGIDVYTLMRETSHMNETIEATLARGLKEEFGVTVKIVKFLGSLASTFPMPESEPGEIQKTTLYFLCAFEAQDERDEQDDDRLFGVASEIEWQDAPFLIQAMRAQGQALGRTDLDESAVLERIQ